MELTHGVPIVLHYVYVSLAQFSRAPAFLPLPKDDKNKDVQPILNLEYKVWVAKDQQGLNYLMSSLSRDILSQVSSVETDVTAWGRD